MNVTTKQKWTHNIENRLVVAKGKGEWAGMKREFVFSRCKLLYIEWVTIRSYCTAQGTIFNIL